MMHAPHIQFTRVSRNAKTGPIPVTTTSEESCPAACPLKRNGCYAEGGPLAILWRKVTERKAGMAWDAAMSEIAKLPKGTLWRHNQAGDLPGIGDAINADAMATLTRANRGKRGYTYTHKPMDADNAAAVSDAIAQGFAVNLSANDLSHADELASLGIFLIAIASAINSLAKCSSPPIRS
jgi:hypothetical protein